MRRNNYRDDEDDYYQSGRPQERDYITKYRHKIYEYNTDDDDDYDDRDNYRDDDDEYADY